jgi:hypothetical protein
MMQRKRRPIIASLLSDACVNVNSTDNYRLAGADMIAAGGEQC